MIQNSDNAAVALITGASSGFGKVTSEILAENGFRVFGTSRNPKSVKEPPRKVEMLELDVTSNSSVKACIAQLLRESGGKLDILINNAGVISLGAIEEMSEEDTMKQFETNLFGTMRVTREVLPIMRAQKSGRIIIIGSIAGCIAVPFHGMYSTSKFALEGYSEQLRQEVKNLGIKVSIVEPGYFKTNIMNSGFTASELIIDYKSEKERSISAFNESFEKGADPMIVAKELLKIITEKNPKLHCAVGKEKSALFFKRLMPQSMFEDGERRVFKLDAEN